jgi:hypothetical protein
VANYLLTEKDYITVKELDEALQKIFITNSRRKSPYERLLIELFTNEFFNDSYLKFTKKKMINKKRIYNILEIAEEYKKEFEELRTKRAKEKFLREKMTEFLSMEIPQHIEEELKRGEELLKEMMETKACSREVEKMREKVRELKELRCEAEEVF